MSETENTCIICWEGLLKKNCCVTECNHQFHTACLTTHFATSNTYTCPCCRTLLNYQTDVDITNSCLIGLDDLVKFGLNGTVTEVNILNIVRDNNIKNNQLTPELLQIVKNAEQLQSLAHNINPAFRREYSEETRKEFIKKQDPNKYALFYNK